MENTKKILSIIISITVIFSILMIVIFVINFRDYSHEREFSKAEAIASLIKDGLTAHMVNGTMSKREFFLNNAKESSGASKIWIFRTKKVVDLFGKGFGNEIIRDKLDEQAVKTGKIQKNINENFDHPTLRITIPYIATTVGQPNCLKCHTNVKAGDVLGGISMIFDLDEARNDAAMTMFKITIIAFIFIIIFAYIISHFLKPYTNMLIFLKDSLQKASQGDYSSRIDIKSDDSTFEVAKWLNTLFEKLEKTIGSIEKNIALFVSDRKKKFKDPLEKAQFVIDDIALIYKFKRTIEQDKSKDIIYQRLIKLFKDQLHIRDLSLYEVDIRNNIRNLIYDDTPDKFCDIADDNPSERCRAYRTNAIVASDDFPDICGSCKTHKEYLCINFSIDDNISLVLNIKPENKDELFENKKAIGYIKNYFESARPVLQAKILMEILQKSNMIDGLTGLYNRKYLDIFMDKKVKDFDSFAIAMLDIDFFKKVNDTYGHNVGDMVLKGLSDVFKQSVNNGDIIFRFGGEEFLIFIPDVKTAHNLLLKIKNSFENRIFEANGETFNKTISAGLSFYKEDSSHVWQVIKDADIALYEAKNSGRNKIVLYRDIKKKKV